MYSYNFCPVKHVRGVYGRWPEEELTGGSARFRLNMVRDNFTWRWLLSWVLRDGWNFDRWRGSGRNISEPLRSFPYTAVFLLGNKHTLTSTLESVQFSVNWLNTFSEKNGWQRPRFKDALNKASQSTYPWPKDSYNSRGEKIFQTCKKYRKIPILSVPCEKEWLVLEEGLIWR